MQQAAFDACGINATYEAIEASRDEAQAIHDRLRRQGYCGWNVTTPLKEAVLPYVNGLSSEAARARALNVIRAENDGSLGGHNTDGAGFMHALDELWSWDPRGASVLILGSGPAARAIGQALESAGAAALSCWSRNVAHAAEIGSPALQAADLVVSTLPPEAEIPEELAELSCDRTIVFDINYGRSRSPLAGMSGLRRSDGLPLLLHQGALSFEWWMGRPAPLAVMRAALAADST
jgi:shikimate dehydrogenase